MDDHEQDSLIISKILVGTVWDFVRMKRSLCGLKLELLPSNTHGKPEKHKEKILTLTVILALEITKPQKLETLEAPQNKLEFESIAVEATFKSTLKSDFLRLDPDPSIKKKQKLRNCIFS